MIYCKAIILQWMCTSCMIRPIFYAELLPPVQPPIYFVFNSEPWSSFSVYSYAAWMHACSVYIHSLTACTLQALMKHLKMALKIRACTSMTCTIICTLLRYRPEWLGRLISIDSIRCTLFFYIHTRLYNTYLYIVKYLISWVCNKMKHFACNRNIALPHLHFHLQSLHMYYKVEPLYKWHSDQE